MALSVASCPRRGPYLPEDNDPTDQFGTAGLYGGRRISID